MNKRLWLVLAPLQQNGQPRNAFFVVKPLIAFNEKYTELTINTTKPSALKSISLLNFEYEDGCNLKPRQIRRIEDRRTAQTHLRCMCFFVE